MEKLEGTIAEAIENSLKTGDEATILQSTILVGLEDASIRCSNFNFNAAGVISINGTFCTSGKFELSGSVIGINLGHAVVDLSKHDYTINLNAGIVGVSLCFYMSGSCLKLRGYVESVFSGKDNFDTTIVCP